MEDKINRFVDNGLDTEIHSPMDPPESHHTSQLHQVNYETLPLSLKYLMDDHKEFLEIIENFEMALTEYKTSLWEMNPSISNRLKTFFRYMDESTPNHNAMEEKAFFPVLHEKLIEKGECGPGEYPSTAVDVMEDDHLKALQSSTLVFNLIGIASRLKDDGSRHTVVQIAYDLGRELAENLRLHILKENEVLIPLAHQLISEDEFNGILHKMAKYRKEEHCFECS